MSRSIKFLLIAAVAAFWPTLSFAASSNVNSLTASGAIVGTQLFYCPIGASTDLKCSAAQIAAYNYSLMSGDCTASGVGAITCTKTNGTAFGTLATLSPIGTGVTTALGVNVGSAGAFVTFNGALGTPSSGTLTHGTGLPISTGVSGLGTGVATALGIAPGTTGAFTTQDGAVTTGDCLMWGPGIQDAGAACGSGSGSISFPQTVAGTITSGGIPYFSNTTTLSSSAALAANSLVKGGGAGVAPSTITTGTGVLTALGVNTGSAGAFVVNGGALGTPSSGTLTNATGLPIGSGVSGLGTGVATALGNSVNASGGIVSPTPAAAGDLAYWNGTAWTKFAGNASGTGYLSENASGVPSWATSSSSITFTTNCPSSSQTGSTIAFDNTLPPTTESGDWTVACGVGYQATITASHVATIPVTSGLVSFIKNMATSTFPVVLTPASGTIDGQSTELLWPGQMAMVWGNGTNVATDLNTVSFSACGEVSGRWCPSIGGQGTTGSVTGGGGNVSCMLYAVSPPGFTAKTIGGYVTTTDATATGFIWLGIYTDTAGFPGTKVDDIGGTAITAPGTNNNAVSASLANTTDPIAPGKYWLCSATPSTTLIMTGVSANATWLPGGSNVSQAVNGANSGMSGFQCTAGSTGCGASWTTGATYSGPANFTGASWSSRNAGAVPNLALQVN